MKVIFNKLLLGLTILILLSNCQRLDLCTDDELVLKQQNLVNSQFRIDGYYYEYLSISTEEEFASIKFLYQNGVYMGYQDILDSSNSINVNVSQIDAALKTKGAWGIFSVSGDSIEIEYWRPVINGCFRTISEKGEIINDTTFIINMIEYRNDGEIEKSEKVNDVYYFKSLPVKPDSTNNFIN